MTVTLVPAGSVFGLRVSRSNKKTVYNPLFDLTVMLFAEDDVTVPVIVSTES